VTRIVLRPIGSPLPLGFFAFGTGTALLTALGAVLTLLAYYGATALLVEDMRHRAVLPVFRHGPAKRSFEGDLGAQVAEIERMDASLARQPAPARVCGAGGRALRSAPFAEVP
jgi:hypothetical protein